MLYIQNIIGASGLYPLYMISNKVDMFLALLKNRNGFIYTHPPNKY